MSDLIQATWYAMLHGPRWSEHQPSLAPAAAKVATCAIFNELIDLGVMDRYCKRTVRALIELTRLRDYPDTWPLYLDEPEYSPDISMLKMDLEEIAAATELLLKAWEEGDTDIHAIADDDDDDATTLAMIG